MSTTKPTRLLRVPQMLVKLGGISRGGLANMERDLPDFPKHFYLSPRICVWDEAEVDAFIAARRTAHVVPVQPKKCRRNGGEA